MNTYVDETGVENIAVAMVKQAREDFIKGAKILYGILKKIPTYKELISDAAHVTLSNDKDVRYMYDAWRFVKEDPYSFFGAGEESIIGQWKLDAIEEHYKRMYIKGGAILYSKKASRRIQDMDNDYVMNLIDDKVIAEEFIAARNYILTLPNHEQLFREWNVVAHRRVMDVKRNPDLYRHVDKTDYIRERSEKSRKNKSQAIELYDSGMSPQAIAHYLGVQLQTVKNYLRS